MEWIRISENKIKVMLNEADALHYALTPACDEGTGKLSKEAFRAILSDVRAAANFEAAADKVYVQLYPSRAGGFELFITRMGVETRTDAPHRDTYKKSGTRTLALCFPTLLCLIAVCKRMLDRGFHGKSTAYKDEEGRYWLILQEQGAPALLREDYRFAAEYGELADAEAARMLLAEHGRCICEAEAVEKIGVL